MASLGDRTTSGELAWDKYVGKNKSWSNLTLDIEKDTELMTKKGVNMVGIAPLPKGEQITLKNNRVTVFKAKKYATVAYGRKTGFVDIKAIRKPTTFKPTSYEAEVVDMINNFISKSGGIPINIKLKGDSKTYKGITGAIQVDKDIKRAAGVTSDPKADIILYVDKKKLAATNNIYISHKKEGGPEAFQQYGGLSTAAGEQIYNHPETKKFLKQVTGYIKDDKLTNPLFKKVKNDTLKNMSIFGPDYNQGTHSLQHATCIGQGKPVLKALKAENTFELDFSSHMSLSGDLSSFNGDYTPVFGATFRAGRGFDFEGKRYNGARVGIYPMKLVAGRGGVEELT